MSLKGYRLLTSTKVTFPRRRLGQVYCARVARRPGGGDGSGGEGSEGDDEEEGGTTMRVAVKVQRPAA